MLGASTIHSARASDAVVIVQLRQCAPAEVSKAVNKYRSRFFTLNILAAGAYHCNFSAQVVGMTYIYISMIDYHQPVDPGTS